MRLIVAKDSCDEYFVESLIDRIKRELYLLLDSYNENIVVWQKYIDNNIKLFSYSEDRINVRRVLESGIESITYEQTKESFLIGLDENLYIKNVYVSVKDICSLINYGNLSVRGIGIFSEEFDKINKGIDKLKELYYTGEII